MFGYWSGSIGRGLSPADLILLLGRRAARRRARTSGAAAPNHLDYLANSQNRPGTSNWGDRDMETWRLSWSLEQTP